MSNHRHNDDDTIIIKPLAFTGTVLLSAGCGLAAGLLICWLMCCKADHEETQAAALGPVPALVDQATLPAAE